MVSYRQIAEYGYLVATPGELIRPNREINRLGKSPYRFDLIGQSKQPLVVGIFQHDRVTSPIAAETFGVRRRILLSQLRSAVHEFKGLEELLPPALIHIGFDPETAQKEMIEHILSDPLHRLGYSPIKNLPDFSRKVVDIHEEPELEEEWRCLNRELEGDADPDAMERRRKLTGIVDAQLKDWTPYGLTFLEYGKWALFKEMSQSHLDAQKD